MIFAVGLLGVAVWTVALVRKGDQPGPVQPIIVTSEADRENPTPSTVAPASATPVDAGIQALLDEWVNTTRHKDLNGQVACYAPVVDTYYAQKHVSHRQLSNEKQRQFRAITTVKKFDVSNVQTTQLSPNSAVILLDKNWDFGEGTKDDSGSERIQLTLRKNGSSWKIVSERQLKVYWLRHNGRTVSPE